MESATFGVCEVVTLVVCDEVENGTLGECGRRVENEPPVFDTRSERTHASTVGVSSRLGKRHAAPVGPFGGFRFDPFPNGIEASLSPALDEPAVIVFVYGPPSFVTSKTDVWILRRDATRSLARK